MRSTVCWSSDARSPSALPEPERGWGNCAYTSDPCNNAGLAARGRARRRLPRLDGFVREPDRQAAALAQAGVICAPIHDLVLLLGNMVAAVLVQLERQNGCPRSGQGGASYAEPVPDATGQVRATKSALSLS